MKIPYIVVALPVVMTGYLVASCYQNHQEIKTIEEVSSMVFKEDVASGETLPEKEATVPAAVSYELQEEEKGTVYESPVNFEGLKGRNDKVAAVITLNSQVYPVLLAEDNDAINYDIDGVKTNHGSIIFDPVLGTDYETVVIHGHHMADGTMFAIVDDTGDAEVFNGLDITVYYPDHEDSLIPMVAITGGADGELQQEFTSAEDISQFAADKTVINGQAADWEGKLYVLVTCDYAGDDYRTYLFCSASNAPEASGSVLAVTNCTINDALENSGFLLAVAE